MILACPACDTRFQLEAEALLPNGRWLRCGKCGNEWRQEPDGTVPQEMPAPPLPEAPPAGATPPRRTAGKPSAASGRAQPRGSRLWLGWVALLIFVATVTGGFVMGRDRILAAVPEMERLYDLVGLGVPLDEVLALEKVISARRIVAGDRVLIITGLVVNISDRPRKLPKLRASVTDAEGQELTFWQFSPSGETLLPGESAPFKTSTSNPPEDAASVLVTFDVAN